MDIKQIIDYLEIQEHSKEINEILQKAQGEEFDKIVYNALNGLTGESLQIQNKNLAQKLGVHEYTLGLVAIISIAEKSEKLFLEKGHKDFFMGALDDIKHKIEETWNLHGVLGTHSFWWQADFFCFNMFAMGRLEFSADYRTNYEYDGIVKINKGDRVLSVHIPSGSKLNIEECYKSLKRAYDYFKEVRIDGYLPVLLTNWFLYPPFEEVFSPNGNLTAFKNLFDVIGSEDYQNYDRIASRVFNTFDVSNPDSLPQKTSLQKKLAQWIKDKKPCGYGIGYLLFDGEKVVTGKKV